MANSIIKWCKTKFLNGYKHINVEASEEMGGNRSDTETLVRTSEKEFLLTTRPRSAVGEAPDSAVSTPNRCRGTRRLNGDTVTTYLQEVTCDVGLRSEAAERQEFSFTLYDFDGHGRVTKDDISGLVQSIYETVGTTLSLPPSGSRTIRVKLSVAPETNPTALRLSELSKDSPRSTNNNSPKTSPRTNDQYSPLSSEQLSPRTEFDDERGNSGIVNDSSTSPEESPRLLMANESPRRNRDIFCSMRDDLETCTPGRKDPRRRRRKRANFHRQELLEIIQANMEKNNLFYPPLNNYKHHNHRRRRRNCFHCYNNYSTPDPAVLKARLMMECCDNSCCNQPMDCKRTSCCTKDVINTCIRHHRSKSQDYNTDSPHVFRHHLLEENVPHNQQHPLPPSNTPDRPISPRTSATTTNHRHEHHHHIYPSYPSNRSRSCEGAENRDGSGVVIPFGREKLTEKNNNAIPPSSPAFKKKLEGGKHKYRQDEHNRAMSQVVAWLERSSFKDKRILQTLPQGDDGVGGVGGDASSSSQHVHYHHHFHHYSNESPSLII